MIKPCIASSSVMVIQGHHMLGICLVMSNKWCAYWASLLRLEPLWKQSDSHRSFHCCWGSILSFGEISIISTAAKICSSSTRIPVLSYCNACFINTSKMICPSSTPIDWSTWLISAFWSSSLTVSMLVLIVLFYVAPTIPVLSHCTTSFDGMFKMIYPITTGLGWSIIFISTCGCYDFKP